MIVYYLRVNALGFLMLFSFFQKVTLGQRHGISAIDAQQMNLLYKSHCNGGGGGGGGGGKWHCLCTTVYRMTQLWLLLNFLNGRSISQNTAGAYLCRRPEVQRVTSGYWGLGIGLIWKTVLYFPGRFHAGDMIKFLFSCQYGNLITFVLDFRQRVVAFACGMVGENTLFFFKKNCN